MKYTSAEAAKLLRKLNDELRDLRGMEEQSCTFNAALGEDLESVRPAYDYAAVQKRMQELEGQIRTVKHAVNCFNLNRTVPGFGMTVDQLLVYIPQLNERKAKLGQMARRLPKQRQMLSGMRGAAAVIDYNYANYDIAAAQADYEAVSDELARAQTALDLINSTETMEIVL